jgi:hypothetical protein
MGGACGVHERNEMCICVPSCGSKNRSKEASCLTAVYIARQY